MTAPTEDLIARLEKRRSYGSEFGLMPEQLPRPALVNPDGPEAAQALRALQQALEPFAKFAEIADADGQLWTDQSSIAEVMGSAIRHTISYGDLRRARSALTGSAQG